MLLRSGRPNDRSGHAYEYKHLRHPLPFCFHGTGMLNLRTNTGLWCLREWGGYHKECWNTPQRRITCVIGNSPYVSPDYVKPRLPLFIRHHHNAPQTTLCSSCVLCQVPL